MKTFKEPSPERRSLLLALAATPLVSACRPSLRSHLAPDKVSLTQEKIQTQFQKQLVALEAESGGRLGVAVLNTANGTQLKYRADERFPFCSTFKALAASAVLKLSMSNSTLLQQRIKYTSKELISYSPITKQHVVEGMTVAELCAAAIQYSDNTAANFLIKLAGGPAGVTAFARSIGDTAFRLDRWETELNTAIPGDLRDTTTPLAMALSLQQLVLGNVLALPQKTLLQDWLKGNTTGAARIRAGVPADWQVGDKTGTGAYGTCNDIAVLWPPAHAHHAKIQAPIVLALYLTQQKKEAKPLDQVLASATRIVVASLS